MMTAPAWFKARLLRISFDSRVCSNIPIPFGIGEHIAVLKGATPTAGDPQPAAVNAVVAFTTPHGGITARSDFDAVPMVLGYVAVFKSTSPVLVDAYTAATDAVVDIAPPYNRIAAFSDFNTRPLGSEYFAVFESASPV